jgi:HSP20 family molecular chaperone IbpA
MLELRAYYKSMEGKIRSCPTIERKKSMTLIRWNAHRNISPFHPVNHFTGSFFNMQGEIDRLLDRLAGDGTDDGKTSTWLPVVDILERDDAFEVRAELPGMKKEDVKITLRDEIP